MKKKFFLIIALCIMQIFVYSGCDKAAEIEASASSLSNNNLTIKLSQQRDRHMNWKIQGAEKPMILVVAVRGV